MATTLISTGIEFPGGSQQTTLKGANVSETFVSNVATFTVSNIPSFTKLTAVFLVSYVSGPSNPSLIAKNTANNVTGELIGGNSVFYASGAAQTPTPIKYAGSGYTNFFSGTSYATFASAKIELFKITTSKYIYKATFTNGSSGPITIGNGTLTLSSGDVTELYLSGANGGWATVFSKVYWE